MMHFGMEKRNSHGRWMIYLSISVIAVTCVLWFMRNIFSEELKPNIDRLIEVIRRVNPQWDSVPYDKYGCWCNSVNKGKIIDGIDGCCRHQFYCYQNLKRKQGCRGDASKYSFTFVPGDIRCNEYNDLCSKEVCECDINLLKCIIDHMTEYRSEHYLKNVKHLCDETS